MAIKRFKSEYEEYLDAIIGDERLLMKHKIQKVGEEFSNMSVAKEVLKSKISQQEVLKDKLLIELLDDPEKLWRHLKVKVRNVWMEREMLRKQLYKRLKRLKGLDSAKFVAEATKQLRSVINSSRMLQGLVDHILKHLRRLEDPKKLLDKNEFEQVLRNGFRIWFFTKFCIEDENERGNKQKKRKRKKLKTLDDF